MKVKAPTNKQILIYPMLDCTISAGFKNKAYKNYYGYVHYGVDFDSKRAVDFGVIASGKGTVLGVEMNVKNSIGGVVVIKYDNVYIPSNKLVKSVIFRYYHLYSIAVKKGQTVNAYDIIGTVSGNHKWWNHVHVEVDTDTKYPFYTPQVSEAASVLLKRGGLTNAVLSKSLLNPIDVLVVGRKQACKVHSLATLADKVKDAPKYEESI